MSNTTNNEAHCPVPSESVHGAASTTWAQEQMVENGIWLSHAIGDEDSPTPVTLQHLRAAKKLGIGPSPHTVREVMGSIDSYNDALGFVNDATLERWSDEEWVENGIWLSHMLGSPQEPVMPTVTNITEAATLRLAPSRHHIYRKFGDFATYQASLGYSPLRASLPYMDWGREDYIQNGIWLSHMLGSPQEPVMPTSRDIRQAVELGVGPPIESVEKNFGRRFSKYQDALGFVTRATLERWSDEEWVENGIWLSHMLGSPQEPGQITKDTLIEASKLNLAPSPSSIRDKFGSVIQYEVAIGQGSPRQFEKWTRQDFLRHGAKMLVLNEKGFPTADQYDHAEGPPYDTIRSRFGSLAKFHEQLGIVDYRSSAPEDLLAYGIQWAVRHDGKPPRVQDLTDEHATGNPAPGVRRIIEVFGSFRKYKSTVTDTLPHYEQLEEQLGTIEGLNPMLMQHLLRNYRPTIEDEQSALALAEYFSGLGRTELSPIKLTEQFKKSRLTAWWEDEDFFNFGMHAFGMRNLSLEESRQRLDILQRAGLCPDYQDFEDIFGGVDEFIEFYQEYKRNR